VPIVSPLADGFKGERIAFSFKLSGSSFDGTVL
jgi:hypothetical protein